MSSIFDFRGIEVKPVEGQMCVLFYEDSYIQNIEVISSITYLKDYSDSKYETSALFVVEDIEGLKNFYDYDKLAGVDSLSSFHSHQQAKDEIWRDVTGKVLNVGDFVYFTNPYGDDYMYTGLVVGDKQIFSSCCRVKSVEQVLKVEQLTNRENKEKSKLSLLYKSRATKTKFERGDVLTNDSCLYICLGKSQVVCSHKVGRELDSFEVSGDNVFYNLGSLDISDIQSSITLLGKHTSYPGFILYSCLNARINLSLKKYKAYRNNKLIDMLNSRKIGFSKRVSGLKYIKHIDCLDKCMQDMSYEDKDTGIKMRFILE